MRIDGTIWLESVVDKLHWKHGVQPEEVEEVLQSRPNFRKLEAGRVRGEDLYAAFGTTLGGRYLKVLFVYKITREALIVSARDMNRREKRRHGRK